MNVIKSCSILFMAQTNNPSDNQPERRRDGWIRRACGPSRTLYSSSQWACRRTAPYSRSLPQSCPNSPAHLCSTLKRKKKFRVNIDWVKMFQLSVSGLCLVYFRPFQTANTICKQCNFNLASGAGIRTHDLSIMSLFCAIALHNILKFSLIVIEKKNLIKVLKTMRTFQIMLFWRQFHKQILV